MVFGLDRGELDVVLDDLNQRYFQPLAQIAKSLSAMLSSFLEAITGIDFARAENRDGSRNTGL